MFTKKESIENERKKWSGAKIENDVIHKCVTSLMADDVTGNPPKV